MKEKIVSSEGLIPDCPCYQNLGDVITDSFVVPDGKGGYIRYLAIDEKCSLCGNVVNSYTDTDDATKEEYRLYLDRRVREGAVFCPYCQDLFDSESLLARHVKEFHTGTVLNGGAE